MLVEDEIDLRDVVYLSTIFVITLVLVIPVLVIWGNLPLLALVPIAGLGYGVFIYQTDRVFPGLTSAFFVLAVFRANVPIADGRPKAQLSLFLVDVLGIAVLVLLVRDFDFDPRNTMDGRLGVAAVLGLALFVSWSYLSALVGNGPSQYSATVFAIQQTRYLLVFVVSMLVVARTNAWVGVYPLMISIAGNLGYAVAEAISGHTFGLTYLGDSGGRLVSNMYIGPWTFTTGRYAGGFVGETRELIALLLLLLPFLVFWIVYGSRQVTIVSALGILGVEFIVRFGETDAGWMASILVLVLASGLFLYPVISSRSVQSLRGLVASLYGIGVSALLYAERVTAPLSSMFAGGEGGPEPAGQGTPNPDAQGTPDSGPQGTPGPGEHRTTNPGALSQHSQDRIADLLAHVPLIETDTLGIRLTQYAAAVDIALVHPVVGIGGYNFILVSETYDLPLGMGIHNTFFSHLAATGIPGFLAYTIAVLAVLVLAGRAMLGETGRERFLWGCVVSGLLGFHAYSFWVVIYGWLAANAGFWALSGIVVGALSFD